MEADVAIPLPLPLPLSLTVAISLPLPLPLPLSLTVAIRQAKIFVVSSTAALVIKALKESEQDRKKITANKVCTEEMEAGVVIRVLCRLGFCAEIRVTIDLFSSYSTITEEGNRFSDTINWFIGINGFGLITPKDVGEDLLVHQSIISGGYRSLAEEESVDSNGDNGSGYGYGSGGGSDGRYFGGSGGDYEVCGYHQDGRRSFSPESFKLGTYSVNEE